MKRVFRKLAALGVLTAFAFLLASPQPSLATWGDCDADFMNRTDFCVNQYTACVNMGQQNCQTQYNSCLDQSGTLKTECINATDPTPQPLPVIDESRSMCMSGCRSGCAEFEGTFAYFTCYMPCYNYCNENYPKP